MLPKIIGKGRKRRNGEGEKRNTELSTIDAQISSTGNTSSIKRAEILSAPKYQQYVNVSAACPP